MEEERFGGRGIAKPEFCFGLVRFRLLTGYTTREIKMLCNIYMHLYSAGPECGDTEGQMRMFP